LRDAAKRFGEPIKSPVAGSRRLRAAAPDVKDFLRPGPDFDALEIERTTEPAGLVDLSAPIQESSL
jgi:hypothetical protein